MAKNQPNNQQNVPTRRSAKHGNATNSRTVQIDAQELRSIVSEYSGPLPPAEQLEHYESVHAGASKVILGEFSKEAEHRRDLEKADARRAGKAQWIAAALISMSFGNSAYQGFVGNEYAAIASTVVGASLLYIAFRLLR